MEIKQALSNIIAERAGLQPCDVMEWFETPKDPAMGDVAFPCFRLAKAMRKPPNAIAAELADGAGAARRGMPGGSGGRLPELLCRQVLVC